MKRWIVVLSAFLLVVAVGIIVNWADAYKNANEDVENKLNLSNIMQISSAENDIAEHSADKLQNSKTELPLVEYTITEIELNCLSVGAGSSLSSFYANLSDGTSVYAYGKATNLVAGKIAVKTFLVARPELIFKTNNAQVNFNFVIAGTANGNLFEEEMSANANFVEEDQDLKAIFNINLENRMTLEFVLHLKV